MGFWDKVKEVGSYAIPGYGAYKAGKKIVGALTDESESAEQKRENLENQGGRASWFADANEDSFNALGGEATNERGYLRKLARGEDSVSAEQLRQGLQQNLSAQRSMAAGAAPANAAMAARTAAIQMGKLGSGMAGQQALAGLQERQQAQQALAQMLMQQRQQDLSAALGSRQTAISAYGGVAPEASFLEKIAPVGQAAAQIIASKSDRRLKTGIKDGDEAANEALEGLKAFLYKYKDQEKHGKGERLGVMAQDLEDAGLEFAVMDEPDGKAIDGTALATANTAMLAALARRVSKLEGGEVDESIDEDDETDEPMKEEEGDEDDKASKKRGLAILIGMGSKPPKK